ncbi:MAG: hypothetical protein V1881_02620 [Candidatus Micrarchaeota archaeon]
MKRFERGLSLHAATAGSFVIGGARKRAQTHGLITFIHYATGFPCGASEALSEEKIAGTIAGVGGFLRELGAGDRTIAAVGKQLEKMALSPDPEQHARMLLRYYKNLGIRNHIIILHNLENDLLTVAGSTRGQNPAKFKDAVTAACSDARHIIPHFSPEQIATLIRSHELHLWDQAIVLTESPESHQLEYEDGASGKKLMPQTKQSPQGHAFQEHPVQKTMYNESFTVVGMSPLQFKRLLTIAGKRKLSNGNIHDLAAASLSAFYYRHHEWPGWEDLVGSITPKKKAKK